MAAGWIEKLTGPLEDKRRYRQFKARVEQLPEGYATAVDGIARYLMVTGPSDSDRLITMLEDLADLFEQSAAAGASMSEIVGDDPVDFVETFQRNYGQSQWLSKEQRRLIDTIARAAGEVGGARP